MMFLSNAGEMGDLILAKSWEGSALGPINTWSPGLRTALSMVLRSKFPMVLMWGKELTFFYNDGYRPTLGNDGKHPAVLGIPAAEVWKEGWDAIKPMIAQVFEKGDRILVEDLLIPIYRNGRFEEVYWTFSYSPVSDEHNAIAGIFISCLETTEKIIREVSFAENLKSLDLAMQIGKLGIFKIELPEQKAIYSAQIKEWMDLEKEEVYLNDFLQKIHPEDRSYVQEAIERSIAGKEEGKHDVVFRVLSVENHDTKFLHSIGQVSVTNQGIFSILGTIQDVSNQIYATKVIEESEARFRVLADQSPMFVFIIEGKPYGKMSYFNKTYLDYTGRSFEEAIVIGWNGIVHPDDLQFVREIYVPAFENQKSYTIPAMRIRRHDGIYKWHMFKGNARHLSSGEFIGYVGVGIDIDEQKKALEQLELNNTHLIRINNDLDNFIYTASHDLKAPMSNIEGLLYALRSSLEADKEKLNDDSEHLLQMMAESIQRFKNTILDLTEISKVQRDQAEDLQEIFLAEIIDDVKRDLYDQIKESSAQISIDLSTVHTIFFSRKNIKSIVYNLISNAIKYRQIDKVPEIFIQTEQADGYLILIVADNGLGIQDTNVDKIFTMFKRFHTHVDGTGIGLYIVKRIVDNAGGKIEVKTSINQGTTFKLYFPV